MKTLLMLLTEAAAAVCGMLVKRGWACGLLLPPPPLRAG